MDGTTTGATAIAIAGDRIEAVGHEEVLRLRRERTEVLDLQGRTVCPGFVDAHHHFALAAWYQRGVDLGGAPTREEALRRIASVACDGDGWLYCYNYRPRAFQGSPLSRYELDRVAGSRPVLVMHFTFHEAVASSAGLEAAGIDRHTADPQGGRIVRDRRGEPTGELLETAAGTVESVARSAAAGSGYSAWLASATRYAQGLFAAGITHLCDPGIDGMMEEYLRRAERDRELPIPLTILLSGKRGLFDPPVDRLAEGAKDTESEWLRVQGLKLFADGGARCASCVALWEAVAAVLAMAGRAARPARPALLRGLAVSDSPRLSRNGTVHTGYLHYPPEELAGLCSQAHRQGFGLAVHAACNEGIASALDAYRRLPRSNRRHRMEHLVSLDHRQMRMIAALGAIGVVQPQYIAQMGDEWEAIPAPQRLRSMPLRDLLDHGVTLAGSSDAPITPAVPLRSIVAAVTRRTTAGQLHGPEQAITPLEALRLWTTGAALALGRADEIGVLRPGAQADLVVLSANPLDVPCERIQDVSVEQTVLGGRTVFSNKPSLDHTIDTA